ncbi:MAG TPA: protocatechuate 3,4-dioxygenase subunit alpha [Candidatus Binataceae bacterium]|nr:protocatechuate 3,4-dioxygenase subunit alpha [Candidatus Binataceae bacterium]
MDTRLTPSQTVGPFFGPAMVRAGAERLVRAATRGERITIEGRVLDGDCSPVPDAMLEIWQANAEGRYDHPEDTQEKRIDPDFHGFGRAGTDPSGAFRFHTIKPGAAVDPDGISYAPHIIVCVFARGLLHHLVTRIYFPDEPAANASDPVLSIVEPSRRATLIARETDSPRERTLRFDIVLQGDHETVFFDV